MLGATITKVTARQVFSGRGHPAVEATVVTENGASGTVQCTAGISIGTHEIGFTYDGGAKWRGKGVMRAVDNVNKIIAPAIVGMDATRQFMVDGIILNLGGPDAKIRLGGNAVAAISAAVLKAGAEALGIPLYQHIGGTRAVTLPCAATGCVSGSTRYSTGEGAGSKPTYSFIAYDYNSFAEASYALWEVFTDWEMQMIRKWGLRSQEPSQNYTCSGFFNIPSGLVESDFVLWDMMTETINRCGHEGKMGLQVDMAADCYYDSGRRTYQGLFSSETRTRDQQIDLLINTAKQYPFVIMEDPLAEDDFEGHAVLVDKTGIPRSSATTFLPRIQKESSTAFP